MNNENPNWQTAEDEFESTLKSFAPISHTVSASDVVFEAGRQLGLRQTKMETGRLRFWQLASCLLAVSFCGSLVWSNRGHHLTEQNNSTAKNSVADSNMQHLAGNADLIEPGDAGEYSLSTSNAIQRLDSGSRFSSNRRPGAWFVPRVEVKIQAAINARRKQMETELFGGGEITQVRYLPSPRSTSYGDSLRALLDEHGL